MEYPLIQTQLLGPGGLLRLAWRLFRKKFSSILLVTLCVYIPVGILYTVQPVDFMTRGFGQAGLSLYRNILFFLAGFIGQIATIGIALIVERAVQGSNLSWREALRLSLSKWMNAISTNLLVWLILFGLTVFFFIPGVIWALYYSFWIFSVTLRNVSGKASLDYSKHLVEGQWWRILGIQLAIFLILAVIVTIVMFPFILISDAPLSGFIPGMVIFIVRGFFDVVFTLFFLNNDYVYRPRRIEGAPFSQAVG